MTKQFKIEGMMCEGCATSVKELIDTMSEVNAVNVKLNENTAEVDSDRDITANDIQKVFADNDKTYKVTDYK